MSGEERDRQFVLVGIMVMMGMLVFYSIIGTYMEKVKPPIGHETGIIILLGIIISIIVVTQFNG